MTKLELSEGICPYKVAVKNVSTVKKDGGSVMVWACVASWWFLTLSKFF